MREISERERERYRRNLLVDGFGEQGQSRLLESRVTVVGAGRARLGRTELSRGGRGGTYPDRRERYGVAEHLQRQVLYTSAEIGAPKAEAAAARLSPAESRLPAWKSSPSG